MKTISIFVLTLCGALLVATAIHSHQQMSDTIASHFNASGRSNGWMSKTPFTISMLAVGLGIPAFVTGVMYSIRFFPARLLNVPNPEYWRDPKNYRKACDFLFVSSLWFGSAFLIWQTFFSRMIVTANQMVPPHLDSGKVMLLTLPLLGFTFAWVLILIFRFIKTNNVEQGGAAYPLPPSASGDC